jgi:hypothetical protein
MAAGHLCPPSVCSRRRHRSVLGRRRSSLTTTVRRVSIRELPYSRRGVTLVASGQSEPEEGGFPRRAYVSEEDPRQSIRLVVRLSSVASECSACSECPLPKAFLDLYQREVLLRDSRLLREDSPSLCERERSAGRPAFAESGSKKSFVTRLAAIRSPASKPEKNALQETSSVRTPHISAATSWAKSLSHKCTLRAERAL